MAHGPMALAAPPTTLGPLDAELIYRAQVRSVYAFIYSKVGNREVAEDLTSDVFVRALTHLDATRAEYSMVAWLFRVARNVISDYWRAGQGVRLLPLEEGCVPWPTATVALDRTQREQAARAHALLDHLPERYRTVLVHRLLEGLSVAETARCMGLSPGNVKVLQHRALKHAATL